MIGYALTVTEPGQPALDAEKAALSWTGASGSHRRIMLFLSLEMPWIAGRTSILIGRLFERGSNRQLIDRDELDQATADGLDRVLKEFWGQYVLVTELDGQLLVLRDPSGSMPCYCGGGERRDVLVSDAVMARSLGLLDRPQLDPAFLRHWLGFPFLRSPRTGVLGVVEVAPGTVISLGSNQRREQLWRPRDFVVPRGLNLDDAAVELRRTALQSIGHAAGEQPIVLQLSGGLDSSILAACLVKRGIPFKAVTFATSSPEGDERHYAADVANSLGFSLETLREDDRPIASDLEPTFRPAANILLEGIDQAVETYRLSVGAKTVVDGGGGDNLFGSSRTAAPVLDALREGRGWETLQSVAERAETGVWQVALVTLKQAFQRQVYWPAQSQFLSGEATLSLAEDHPWLEDCANLLPGKREHLASLVHIQHFLDRHAIGAIHSHPLMNQVLIEYCLSVPSWMWNADGRDRTCARRAFAGMLPPSIINRRTKGSLQGYFHRRFRANRPLLAHYLLDGELARSGITDRRAIEAALANSEGPDDETAMRLSEIATLERWLGRWRVVGG